MMSFITLAMVVCLLVALPCYGVEAETLEKLETVREVEMQVVDCLYADEINGLLHSDEL